MSISFTAMQNALLANGMYEITEDTRLYAELKAYDAGFQTLHDQLDELLQETVIVFSAMTTSFTLTCGMNSNASSIASNTFCSHLESLAAIWYNLLPSVPQ